MKHTIDSPETFALRQPVLEAMSSLDGKWQLADGGKVLDVSLPLDALSPHQRDVVEFAINPYSTAKNIFNNLDRNVQQALATAIYKIFG